MALSAHQLSLAAAGVVVVVVVVHSPMVVYVAVASLFGRWSLLRRYSLPIHQLRFPMESKEEKEAAAAGGIFS